MSSGFRQGLIFAAAVLVLDQLIKWWVVAHVMQPSRVIEVTPFFNLVMAWNRGVSFGMFNNASAANVWILTVLALGIVAALLVWLRKAEGRAVQIAIGLIVGGALGNVIDRMRFGAVADFLDFHVLGFHWPAFNVADGAITLGAIALVLDSLFTKPEKPKNDVPRADKTDAKI